MGNEMSVFDASEMEMRTENEFEGRDVGRHYDLLDNLGETGRRGGGRWERRRAHGAPLRDALTPAPRAEFILPTWVWRALISKHNNSNTPAHAIFGSQNAD